jgi:hypothetical protein
MMSKFESLFFISLSFVLFKDWTFFYSKTGLLVFLVWEILPLDFFAVGDCATGLFCCGRLCYWTFLLWEILLLDFWLSLSKLGLLDTAKKTRDI